MSQSPKVVNRHHYHRTRLPDPWIYVGRGTALGNPFTVEEHGREEALRRYRLWLWEKLLRHDPEVLEMMSRITPGMHLVCSCAPKPCHADIIVDAWKRLQEKDRR